MVKARNTCSNKLAKYAGLLFWFSLLGLALLGYFGDKLFKSSKGCFFDENSLDDGGMQTQKAMYIDYYVYCMNFIYAFIVGNSVFKSV